VGKAGTVLRHPATDADLSANVKKEEKKKRNRRTLPKAVEPVRKCMPSRGSCKRGSGNGAKEMDNAEGSGKSRDQHR